MTETNKCGKFPGPQCNDFTVSTGLDEFNIIVHAPPSPDVPDQIAELNNQLTSALATRGLLIDDIVFCRFFLTDIKQHADVLKQSDLFVSMSRACVSLVGQGPLGAGSVAMHAYCLKGDTREKQVLATLESDGFSAIRVATGNNEFLWTGGMTSTNPAGSFEQTDEIFKAYVNFLAAHGYNLNPDTLRTWIYVDDVDTNYGGMVDARRLFFDRHGLTKNTHYIASTGIEAAVPVDGAIVAMDAIASKGLSAEQVSFLQAPENLGPTHMYNVTFERGTRVSYGDRSHVYISGTASIDKNGTVIHVGDAAAQTHRTIDNIEALLASSAAAINHTAYLLIYLRNSEDYDQVQAVVNTRIPATIPRLYLHGPVCRPTWLVEIEGIVMTSGNPCYPPL